MSEARLRLAVACRMALLAWRSGVTDLSFGPLYEIVDWPTSQLKETGDADLEAMANFAVRLGDAITHGAPTLKGLSLMGAMDELEENAARLERKSVLTPYADTYRH